MSVVGFVFESLKEIATKWRNEASKTTPCKPIHSITRFEDLSSMPIVVGNPKVSKTKGSGKGGHPTKDSERFISGRES